MTTRNLDALLAPRSVVLVGASPEPGSVGNIALRNLLAAKFRGSLQLVNPKYAEVSGVACHRSIADLPAVPDLALVATPPATLPGIISELGRRGTRAAVVITAGLDAATKQAMLTAAKPHCLRIQGPNCLGLMLPPIGLDASFSHRAPARGDLAFLSQSGALITSIVDWAAARAIGFSHVVSLGDMADVDFGDLIDYLAADPQSRAILLYMESVTNAPKFMSAARRAARAKPVVVIKSGRHAAGAKAAMSHTGALAGSDKAYAAAFERAGLLRVRALEELFDAAEILSRGPRLTGERLMIVTNGGGAGVLAADRLADWHGTLADLSGTTRAALDEVLPTTWSHANPVDIIGDATPERYAKALDVVLNDDTADAVLVMNCPTALSESVEAGAATLDAIARHRKAIGEKPVLTVWLGDIAADPARKAFRAAGIPSFETPDDAISAFMQLARHARAQRQLTRTPPSLPTDLAFDAPAASAIIAGALRDGRSALTEAEAKDLLATYGIPTVPTEVAATPADAARIAEKLLANGGSVVLKIVSRDISHKSDVGGVRLDLTSPDEVGDAARLMLDKVAKRMPGAHVTGFAVQPMIKRPKAHELLLGMSTDTTFGPLMTFGAGGTSVEVTRDTKQALPPLDLGLARDLIRGTRIARLLAGYRDRAAADLDAIALNLVRLSYLISAHPEIRELDINPLLADEKGVIALDARVSIADQQKTPRVPMAIRPYPTEWETSFEMPGGQGVLIRPVRPDDEARYGAFFGRVGNVAERLALFRPAADASHAFIARLTQIDYARDMAFAAIDDRSGDLMGAVRFAADPDHRNGEFAILVHTTLEGQGLGRRLLQHLIRYAEAEGIGRLSGAILSGNTTMLDLCRDQGFALAPGPVGSGTHLVSLDLAPGRNSGPQACPGSKN